MRSVLLDTLKVLALIAAVPGFLAALLVALFAANSPAGMTLVLFLMMVGGMVVYAFVRTRHARQSELAQVLVAAVETDMPLAPAVRAYLRDRPSGGPFQVCAAAAVNIFAFAVALAEYLISGGVGLLVAYSLVMPVVNVVWLVLWWQRFDPKLARFVRHLEDGESVSAALAEEPAVAGREVRLAAVVGETTNTLAMTLRRADHERWSAVWLEVAPRLIYPFLILLVVSGVTGFQSVRILPRFKRIFDEFGHELPPFTRGLYEVAGWLGEIAPLLMFGVAALIVGTALSIASPTFRWYVPVLGRLYRWDVQGQVLRTLGQLLAAGKTVPASLEFLSFARELPPVVRDRLEDAEAAVEAGEPLADALRGARLLPVSMAPLVRSAQNAGNLPWALAELGDHLNGRAVRLMRRVSLLVAPLLVAAIGVVVGCVAVGTFLPLIQLISGMGE